MAMPAAKGLFHRAIVQSGPFLRSLSPDYSGRLAELVLAELGLSKSRVRELQGIPVDRLSGAAAEAMKKMPVAAALDSSSVTVRTTGARQWTATYFLVIHLIQVLPKYQRMFRYSPAQIFTNSSMG